MQYHHRFYLAAAVILLTAFIIPTHEKTPAACPTEACFLDAKDSVEAPPWKNLHQTLMAGVDAQDVEENDVITAQGAEPATWNEGQWADQLAVELGGVTEYVLPDKTRVDILTDDVAWEVDWGKKWAEGLGQALYYGIATDRRPGVILLLRKNEQKYYLRALVVCAKHNIKLKIKMVPNRPQ